jgi:L-ribulose-5-phosphate 4-epimerase
MEHYLKYAAQITDTARFLVEKGILKGTGGNLSLRIPGEQAFAITPSNYDYMKMTPEDICILKLDGTAISSPRKPSIESTMHAAIYTNRPDVSVVFHTHQEYASALALINEPIPALFDEQVRFLGRAVNVINYAPSGTGWLMKNVRSKLRDGHNAYLLQNHGALVMGPDIDRTIFNLQLLEKCALTYLITLCTERKVTRIPAFVREIIYAKLRSDEKKIIEQN